MKRGAYVKLGQSANSLTDANVKSALYRIRNAMIEDGKGDSWQTVAHFLGMTLTTVSNIVNGYNSGNSDNGRRILQAATRLPNGGKPRLSDAAISLMKECAGYPKCDKNRICLDPKRNPLSVETANRLYIAGYLEPIRPDLKLSGGHLYYKLTRRGFELLRML